MSRFGEFTSAPVSRTSSGYPNHVVVTLFDEELFKYPFIFMSDVGTVGFDSILKIPISQVLSDDSPLKRSTDLIAASRVSWTKSSATLASRTLISAYA